MTEVKLVYGNSQRVKALYDDSKNISSSSRYRAINKLVINDKLLSSRVKKEQMKIEATSYTSHTVTLAQKNRIDKIALLYYRDSSMYWVICYENRIKNPLILEAGTILRIPTSNSLYRYNGILGVR